MRYLGVYGELAARHMARWQPSTYAAIPAEEREAYFLRLDDEVEQAVRNLELSLKPPTSLQETDHQKYVGQMNMARVMAEEEVLKAMVYLPPEPGLESEEEEPETGPVIYDAIYDGGVVRSEWQQAAGALIADARARAGMTQAELAVRAHTVQSAIAAYEAGRRQPTLPTLYRILAAAGFDLRARLAPVDDHDDTLAAWEASLPEAEQERWRAKLAGQRQSARAWASS